MADLSGHSAVLRPIVVAIVTVMIRLGIGCMSVCARDDAGFFNR